MIQLKQNDKSREGAFNICIDDSSYSLGWAYKTSSEKTNSFQYFVNGERNCWVLANQTVEDFEPFSVITFDNLFSWMKKGHSVIISDESDEDKKSEILKVSFYFSPNLAVWSEKYTFAEYFTEFNKFIETIQEPEYDISYENEPVLRLDFYVSKYLYQIKDILLLVEKDTKQAHEKAIIIFQERYQQNLIQSVFNFPEEIKFSCKQYLEYFAQFLQDLGINVTSNLNEEAGKVLFSVTPTDDIEALDKIRKALALYLHLPSSPIVYDDSFASMRLRQQIENLEHSQKMAVREIQLAEKVIMIQSDTIREKNTIISQKDSTIEQQSKIIEKISSKSIMMDSVENKEELEEIYDGLKIGESKFLKEQLGIHINPAKVIKTAVKNTFGKDGEKKSVLGLNED